MVVVVVVVVVVFSLVSLVVSPLVSPPPTAVVSVPRRLPFGCFLNCCLNGAIDKGSRLPAMAPEQHNEKE